MLIGKAKVSAKGWIVVPKEIRDAMSLRAGDEVQLFFWPPMLKDDPEGGRLTVFRMPRGRRGAKGQGAFEYLCGEKPITEELIEERRAEVEQEEREVREWRRGRRTSA